MCPPSFCFLFLPSVVLLVVGLCPLKFNLNQPKNEKEKKKCDEIIYIHQTTRGWHGELNSIVSRRTYTSPRYLFLKPWVEIWKIWMGKKTPKSYRKVGIHPCLIYSNCFSVWILNCIFCALYRWTMVNFSTARLYFWRMDMDAFCWDDKIVVNFSTAHVDFLAYGCFLAGRRLLVYKPYIYYVAKI